MSKINTRDLVKDNAQKSNKKNSKQRQRVFLDEFEAPLNKIEIDQFLKHKGIETNDNLESNQDPIVSFNKPSRLLSEDRLSGQKTNNLNSRSNRRIWSQLSDQEKVQAQNSSLKLQQRNDNLNIPSSGNAVQKDEPFVLPPPTIIPSSTPETQGLYFDPPEEFENNNFVKEGYTQSLVEENGKIAKIVSADDGSSVQVIFSPTEEEIKQVKKSNENGVPKAQLVIESIIDERAPNVHQPSPNQKPNLSLQQSAIKMNKGYGAKFTNRPVLEKFSYVKNRSTFRFNSIPNAFDWRTKTSSEGNPFLSPVRDQGACGSCYAFATVSAFEARIRIATDGIISEILSPQDMVNCGSAFVSGILTNPARQSYLNELYNNGTLAEASWYALEGCNGGLLASAADYVVLQGLPKESDVPYTGTDGTCKDGYKRFKGYKAYDLVEGIENGFPTYQVQLPSPILQQNILNMQMAIMNDGPIVAGLNIYTDFLYYPQITQVYYTQSSFMVGGKTIQTKYEGAHAVAIVGWGETVDGNGQPLPYWICQNSWGQSFGFDGFFYIKRGVNMANIELYATAIFPDTPSFFASSGQGVDTSFSLAPGTLTQSDTVAGIAWYWWIVIAFAIAVVLAIVIAVSVVYTKKNKDLASKQTQRAPAQQTPSVDIYDIR